MNNYQIIFIKNTIITTQHSKQLCQLSQYGQQQFMQQKNLNQNDLYWQEMTPVDQNIPPLKDEIPLSQKTEQKQSKVPMLQPQIYPTINNFSIKIVSIVVGALTLIIIFFILQSFQDIRIAELDFQEGVIQYNTTLGSKYCWIRQILDHQSDNSVYWKQRLLISNESSKFTINSPIFLYIPSQSYIKQAQRLSLFVQMARKHNGLMLGLQQRYFGQSLPFGDDSHNLQNLKYLTISQTISDIVTVITRIKSLNLLGISEYNPWIINGMCLSGTIAALFQVKYPGLAVGVIASSPHLPYPLTPKIEELLYSKLNSGGKICLSIVKNILNDLENKLYSNYQTETIQQYGGGQPFTAEQILQITYYKLQVMERPVYIDICNSRNEARIKQIFNRYMLTDDYIAPFMQSQQEQSKQYIWKQFQAVRDERSKSYLKCSQVGLFNVAGNQHLLFSQKINENYYREKCRFVFGVDIWPNTDNIIETTNKYIKFANNLLIVQGYYDINLPYCLIPQNNSNSTIVKILKCSNCQSCPDSFNRPTQRVITQIRQFQSSLIDSWLQQHQKTINNKSPL